MANSLVQEMTGLLRSESHQCVLQLHVVINTGYDIFLVLEYVPGPSLLQALHKTREVSW